MGQKYSLMNRSERGPTSYRWVNIALMTPPPDKPFWKNRKRAPAGSSDASGTTCATPDKSNPPTITISPGKRVNLRGQCVEQLLRLHQLMEKGGISKAEYDEMHESILTKVRKF